MAADPSSRRLHLWSGLVVLGVFLAGAAAGAGLHAWLRPPFPGPPRPPPHAGARLPPPLGELDLSPEQQRQVRAVAEKYRPAMEAVVAEGLPRMRALVEEMEREVRPLLTEPQRRAFDEHRARRGPVGPGGFGPAGGPLPGAPPGPPPGEPPPGRAPPDAPPRR